MAWKQDQSGVITIASAGSWFANTMLQNHPTANPQSVGMSMTLVGSDRVFCVLIINE